MPATSPTRIRLAARFVANELSISVLTRSWTDDIKVLIRVGSSTNYGRDPLETWIHGRWHEQSQLLTYWGPQKADDGCLVAVLQKRHRANELRERMNEVIETYLLDQLDCGTADRLRRELKKHLRKVKLTNFVDGETDNSWKGILGLASAQNLAAKAATQGQLNSKEREVLQMLLTVAPLQFGYWGPFKTALKHLDPRLMPREFGIALARLSKPFESSDCSSEVEDLTWMEAFTDIPSENTLLYMARRTRRQLAKIGRNDPALYTSIASSMLQTWDSKLREASYLPAYVIGGGQQVLDATSRFVAIPLDQSSRRDAHPTAWDHHRDLLRKMLPQITISVETFTFAAQVLLACGEKLPSPKGNQLALALRSSDSRLVTWGCAITLRRPSQWKSLSIEHWKIFLDKADTDQIVHLLEKQCNDPLPRVVSAATYILASDENCENLAEKSGLRLRSIADYYIKAVATNVRCRRHANSRATSHALLNYSISLCVDDIDQFLSDHLKDFDGLELMELYCKLQNRLEETSDILTLLETSLLSIEIDKAERRQLILRILRMTRRRTTILGWKLLDRGVDNDELLASIWHWLKCNEPPDAFTQESWQERRIELLGELLVRSKDITAKVIDLLQNNVWQINSAQLARLMLQYPACLRAIWDSLAEGTVVESAELRAFLDQKSGISHAVGELLKADDLSVASNWQQQLLLRYVHKSNRIILDPAFAVAAVAIGDLALQRECLEQLRQSRALEGCWLRLAELGLPQPLEFVRLYLNELESNSALTDAILACVDSIVPVVRDLGLEMIVTHAEQIEHDRLWPALSQSDDPVVQARVAEESVIRSWPDYEGLAAFDRRLLVNRRTNRRAKGQVQNRLTSEQLLAPARRAALLDLARGANSQDREWALRRIAELTLSGVPFDGVALNAVTTAANTGGIN